MTKTRAALLAERAHSLVLGDKTWILLCLAICLMGASLGRSP